VCSSDLKSRISYSKKKKTISEEKKNSTVQSFTKRLAMKNEEFVQVILSLFTKVQIICQSLCK